MKVTEYDIINKKSVFIIEENNIKFYAIEIYDNGHEIICYGNNKIFMLFDDRNNIYYDAATETECNGEICYAGVLVENCNIPNFDKILSDIKETIKNNN